MEYREIYDYTYNETALRLERLIVLYFKSGNKKNRPYDKVYFNILNRITSYLQEGYLKKFNNNEREAYSLFLERNSLYQGDELDVIVWVLEDEVKNAFKGNTYKSYNYFIRSLAISASLLDMYEKFKKSESYTLLVYEQNRYDLFSLKNFEPDTFKSSKGYKEMVDIKYPNGISEREIVPNDKSKTPLVKDVNYDNPNENTLELIKTFNDNEKVLIISVFYNLVNNKKASEIKLTEFIKLLKIAGSYEDVSLFNDKSESNTLYSKASKGLSYYKGKSPFKLIESTLYKLKDFDLKFIYEALLRERRKLLSEKNKKS